MRELLTAAQMRAIERAAIESGAVRGLELMERAGRAVVEAMFETWPELAQAPEVGRGGQAPIEYLQNNERDWTRRAVVLCGPGNNGGDGFVVARLLQQRGWAVAVYLYGDPERLPPDARVNYERWQALGAVEDILSLEPGGGDVLVDGLFGTGLTRPVGDDLYNVFDGILDDMDCDRRVAIDVPSGLCADSGVALDYPQARALPVQSVDLTVTFHLPKLGHYLCDGPEHCGRLVCKSIGLPYMSPRERLETEGEPCWALDDVILYAPGFRPSEYSVDKAGGHKYSHGHALVLSGRSGKGGAARLAARGALRVGAGLVTLGVPHEALVENAAQLTAVMLREVEDAGALREVLKDRRITALCLGPGLGLDRAKELVTAALALPRGGRPDRGRAQDAPALGEGAGATRIAGDPGRAVVLDADALTAFADAPAQLFAMLHEGCVLTPHEGEFARLFPDIAEKLATPATHGPAYSKVEATRAAAARAGCAVLFKGADTVVAGLGGACSVNAALYERAAPWLATAGSGDVLAGIITGLMARGIPAFQAAEIGAWLHVECARKFGPGLIAEDLPEQLPAVFRDLGL